MLTIHLHLPPRLRINGAKPHSPIHAFIAWTGKTLDFIRNSTSSQGQQANPIFM
jgi:hypothetical protein